MDPRLLEYYNRELAHLREVGGEFAREFPKIAGRLALDSFGCADPYVERLLEGFAFLAARVQLKIDSEFPRFTEHLLEALYPHYLAPVPSMAVVEFQPDLTEGSLGEGFVVPRGTVLRSLLGRGEQTACEYRTGHDVTLWPLELTEVEYFSRDVARLDIPDVPGVKAGIRFRLRSTAGLNVCDLPLDRLPVFLRGGGEITMRLYEQLIANAVRVVVRPAGQKNGSRTLLPATTIRQVGFDDEQSLLPAGPRTFRGYRLLQEYFTLPDRYLFVEFTGLAPSVSRCEGNELEIIVLLNRNQRLLESSLEKDDVALFCAPAINLFPKRADRIHLSDRGPSFHVVPDRTRPLDFEVFQVNRVVGYGAGADDEQEFLPFYSVRDDIVRAEHRAYYSLHRAPHGLSAKQRLHGPRSSYVGSDLYISLVDDCEAPFRHDLRQLAIETLCTNRDLPLHMPLGTGRTDFTLESGAPVDSVRCVAGPTRPRHSPAYQRGELSWRLINHLSLNYLSLLDNDERQGAAALRDLLKLYGEWSEPAVRRQIEGVRSVSSRPVTRRMPIPGPIAFGRGVEITLTCDEAAFEGSGVFLLGAVLEQFFAKYVSINSFTETVVRTLDAEVNRWPVRTGRRHTL